MLSIVCIINRIVDKSYGVARWGEGNWDGVGVGWEGREERSDELSLVLL